MAPVKVAVLDDYQEISTEHFAALDSAKFDVTVFSDTLLPYNHPEATQDDKGSLVKRLEPFEVICKSCCKDSADHSIYRAGLMRRAQAQ